MAQGFRSLVSDPLEDLLVHEQSNTLSAQDGSRLASDAPATVPAACKLVNQLITSSAASAQGGPTVESANSKDAVLICDGDGSRVSLSTADVDVLVRASVNSKIADTSKLSEVSLFIRSLAQCFHNLIILCVYVVI
jgi:hypothetical protein